MRRMCKYANNTRKYKRCFSDNNTKKYSYAVWMEERRYFRVLRGQARGCDYPEGEMMAWKLVKTALLGRWEVSLIGKDGLISKHGDHITEMQMQEICFDFLEKKLEEMPDGFTVKPTGYHMIIEVRQFDRSELKELKC